MKKYVLPFLLMAVSALASLSCKKDNAPAEELSYVYLNTLAAEDISPISAKLNAEVQFQNFAGNGTMGLKFYYCQSDTPVNRYDMYEIGSVTPVQTFEIKNGQYGIVVENLLPGKEYYFMPHLSVMGVSLVAEVLHFKTQDFCATVDVRDTTATGATVNALAVLSLEEKAKAKVGIEWTDTDFDDVQRAHRQYIDNSTIREDGSFSFVLAGLTANTRYWVRAVVSMDGKAHYANVLEFKTKSE